MPKDITALAGEITVSSAPLIANLVVPVLLQLRPLFPKAAVTYIATPGIMPLVAGQQQVAVRTGARPADPDATALPLGRLRFGFFGTMDYVQEHGLLGDDLSGHSFVTLNGKNHIGPCEEWLIRRGGTGRVLLRTNDETAYMHVIRQGRCAGALPISVLAYNTSLIELVEPLPEWWVPLWLVVPAANYQDRTIRAAVDIFADRLSLSLSPAGPGDLTT